MAKPEPGKTGPAKTGQKPGTQKSVSQPASSAKAPIGGKVPAGGKTQTSQTPRPRPAPQTNPAPKSSSARPGAATPPTAAKPNSGAKPAPVKAAQNARGNTGGSRSKAAAPPVETGAGGGEFLNLLIEGTISLLLRVQRFGVDIFGTVLLALGLMTLTGLLFPALAAGILARALAWLRLTLGWGSYAAALLCVFAGAWLWRRRYVQPTPRLPWGRLLLLEVALFCGLAFLSISGGSSLERAQAGLDGGSVGWALSEMLRMFLEPAGLGGGLWRALVFGVLALGAFGLALVDTRWLRRWAGLPSSTGSETVWSSLRREEEAWQPTPVVHEMPVASGGAQPQAPSARKRPQVLPPEFRKNFRLEPQAKEAAAAPVARAEHLPPLALLSNEQSNRPDERHINLTAGLIEKTLSEFGIPAKVVGFRIGPTVTQFAVEPGFVEKEKSGTDEITRMKIRVAQIAGLQRDLTLALAASRLRIEAPVPGRPYVGIEVPNSRSTVVRLRPLLESEAFQKVSAPLAIALGRDVSGNPVVADLTKMPHLLIAGTTGSGKSVAIAALTVCLVMNNPPSSMRMVMVDPKMVELVRFNGLPHLLGKVETDVERILAVLRWTVAEMDHRYKLLEAARARNIDTYNRKPHRSGGGPLPHLVVMIDELADLMMSAPDQTEHNLVRLAQMARAVGIHLIVATQRPSTDVVTGLIKANFPARISFAVASSIDSRVILDSVGAESLLGRGDMLFLPPEASAPIRSQGAMVTDQEVERVLAFWQKAAVEQASAGGGAEVPPWDAMLEQEAVLADRDDLVTQATEIVRQEQRASASLLQRRLRIGYPRAARLIDELEELGVIAPASAGREREVLVARNEEQDEEDV